MMGSVARLADAGLAILENRLQLFSTELREEKSHLIGALLLAAAVTVLGIMALTLLSLCVVFLVPEAHRAAAMLGLTIFHISATVAAGVVLRARLRKWSPFSCTLAELRKDRICLINSPGVESPNRNS